MFLHWKFRYFDGTDKQFKDRDLFLDTESLTSITRAAIELAVETKSQGPQREFLKFRSLFKEVKDQSLLLRVYTENGRGIILTDYIEDEAGNEISMTEAVRVHSGNPNAVVIPGGLEKHEIEFVLAEPKPVRN